MGIGGPTTAMSGMEEDNLCCCARGQRVDDWTRNAEPLLSDASTDTIVSAQAVVADGMSRARVLLRTAWKTFCCCWVGGAGGEV